jgi:protein associated with RNAse G/E
MLIPDDEWWVATWDFSEELELYVDVATPAVWKAVDHVTAVDLDLDVIRFRDGRVVLDDEDEFAQHQVEFGYPDDVVIRAQATAEFLLDAVRLRTEPFGSAYELWQGKLGGVGRRPPANS